MNEKELTNSTEELLIELVKNQKRNFKILQRIFITVVICYTLILISLIVGFFWYESQFEYGYTETSTVTQEVDGENSSINNVAGNMYNDNAIHNEGK